MKAELNRPFSAVAPQGRSGMASTIPEYEKNIDDVLIKAFDTNHPMMLDWANVKIELKRLRNQCLSCGLKQSVDEALNSGDGAYRP